MIYLLSLSHLAKLRGRCLDSVLCLQLNEMSSSIDSDQTACNCHTLCCQLLETCTSGLFSPSQPRRFTTFLIRLPLFIAPIFLSIPFISLLEAPLGLTPHYPYFSLAYGVLISILVTSLHSGVWILNRRSRARTADISSTQLHSPSSECSLLFAAVFPDRGHFINVLIQGVLSGVLCAAALAALLPSQLTPLFGHSWPLFFLLGWLSVSLAHLPLISAPSLETAVPVQQSGTLIQVEFLSRPTHTLFFLTLAIIFSHYSPVLSLLFYSFLFATPLLWLIGLLPPFSQFLPLLAERSNTLLFASTALSSRIFTLLLCLIWWTLVPLISLVPCDMAAVALFGIVSYCLSLNLFGWILLIISWISSLLPIRTSEFISSALPFKPYFVRKGIFTFSCKITISLIVRFILFPLTCLSLLSISHLGASLSLNSSPCRHELFNSYNCSIQTNSTLSTNTSDTNGVYVLFQVPTFYYLFIAYGLISPLPLIFCYFLSVVQRRTFLFNLLNNPFYPRDLYNELDFNTRIQKNCLFKTSRISIMIMRDFGSRVLGISFLGFFLYSSRTECTPSLLFNIAVARSLHLVWRAPLSLSLEITLAVFIDLLLLKHLSWMSLSVGVHLLIIGSSIQFLSLFLSKLRVVLSYLGWYMVSEQSSHLTYLPEERATLTCISILLLPFTLLILLPMSSLLSLTLVPLFTLPIFFPTYPHSSSYWPPLHHHSSWGGKGAVFYEQTCSEVCRVFRQLVRRGVILFPSPGQVYLFRFEDRMIFLTVNEVGYEYLCVSYKGLELAATSCHEVEATKIDDILERKQTTHSVLANIFNRYFLYLMTPITHSVISTYSEARSSLRPIINSRTTIQKCREYFPKCFAWLIIREVIERERKYKNTSKKKRETEQTDLNITHREMRTPITTVIVSPLHTSLEKNENVTVSNFKQVWGTGFSNERHTPDSLFTEELESLPDVTVYEDNILNISNAELDKSTNQLPQGYKHPLTSTDNPPPVTRTLWLPTPWSDLPISGLHCAASVDLSLIHKFSSHLREQERDSPEGDQHQIVLIVHKITNFVSSIVHPNSNDQSFNKLTGVQICKNFSGKFQWSEGLSWLSNIPDLLNLATKAYRYTLKLTLDEMVLLLDDTDECLVDNLLELDKDWYLGNINEDKWKQEVLADTPHLLLLSQNSARTKYYSHMLTLKHQLLHIASLQPESLHGVWSSQLLELLYLKNEEEERYSVQVEEHFFRNVSTQAGDTPAGYPVFSSAPLYT